MGTRVLLSVFLFAALLALAGEARGQRLIYVGFGFGGAQFQLDDAEDPYSGGTFNLDLGYFFNPTVGLRSSLGISPLNGRDVLVVTGELGPRFMVIPRGKLRPYLDLNFAYSSYDLGLFRLNGRGIGASGGAGMQYFINDLIAVDAGFKGSRLHYFDNRVVGLRIDDHTENAWLLRGRVGLSLYFR